MIHTTLSCSMFVPSTHRAYVGCILGDLDALVRRINIGAYPEQRWNTPHTRVRAGHLSSSIIRHRCDWLYLFQTIRSNVFSLIMSVIIEAIILNRLCSFMNLFCTNSIVMPEYIDRTLLEGR